MPNILFFLRVYLCLSLGFAGISASAQGDYFLYSSATQFDVVLNGKNDFSVGIGIVRGGIRGIQVNTSYALSSKWLLHGTFLNSGVSDVRSGIQTGSQYRYGDFAVGYYQKNWLGTGSILVGGSYGDLYNGYDLGRSARFGITRAFIQPTMTFRSRYLQYGVSVRASRVNFFRGDIDFSIPVDQTNTIRLLETTGDVNLAELGLTTGLRFDDISLMVLYTTGLQNLSGIGFNQSNIGFTVNYYYTKKAVKKPRSKKN
jgi:hypothetical protein